MLPSSLPRPKEEDLDFDDPPNYVRDDLQRAFWCINRDVREILNEYKDQEVFFCYHNGFCTFQSDADPSIARSRINSHFQKNPGHRLSTQDLGQWRREAADRRRMRDDLRRRRLEDDRDRRPHRRQSPVPHRSDSRNWSRNTDRSRYTPPHRYRDPPSYRESAQRRSRSPRDYGNRSRSPQSRYEREGQMNSWRSRTPSGSPSPPPGARRFSPKTKRYPPPPNHTIDRVGDRRSSSRYSPPRSFRQFSSRSPPGSRSHNSPFSQSGARDRERSGDSPGTSSLSRPPPHRGYHFTKDYSYKPGVVGRYNSKKDPKYKETIDDRSQEWVCVNRGKHMGCTKVFHNQDEYIEHIDIRQSNGGSCPEIPVARRCRDEGSIRGCDQEFNRLDAYQEHISIRNKTRDRRCPQLHPEVRDEVKPEPRPGPLYTGAVEEVDLANSPEYVAPGHSPASPVPVSPTSSVPAPPPVVSKETSTSLDRSGSVSPPPSHLKDAVSMRDDGVMLIQPDTLDPPAQLPDVVTSSNPGPSFKIRLPSKPVEKTESVIEDVQSPTHKPRKLDETVGDKTVDSDVVPSTPLMGSLSSTMTGASPAPVAESTPRTLSLANAEEKAPVSRKEKVPIDESEGVRQQPDSEYTKQESAHGVLNDASFKASIQSDTVTTGVASPKPVGREKFKLPSCFTDEGDNQATSSMNQLEKVSAKRKCQDDEMELLLDKKRRGQLLKKAPDNLSSSIKEQEVVTVDTSAVSLDESEETLLKSWNNAPEKSAEINKNTPAKLSFGLPSIQQSKKSSCNIVQKPTSTLDKNNASSKQSVNKGLEDILNKPKRTSQELSVAKVRIKSKSNKIEHKDSFKGKFKEKSHKKGEEKSSASILHSREKKPQKDDAYSKNSFIQYSSLQKSSEIRQTENKKLANSNPLVESNGEEGNKETSVDDLLADDEPESETTTQMGDVNVVTNSNSVQDSPDVIEEFSPNDNCADNPNEYSNNPSSEQTMTKNKLSDGSGLEIQTITSEEKVAQEKVLVKFCGEEESAEMVSLDPDDQNHIDSSWENPSEITPDTSVSSIVKRIVNKRSGIRNQKETIENSSDRENGSSDASEDPPDPSLSTPLSPCTLKRALRDSDEDSEDATEEDEEECSELVFGKDSCTACPGCNRTLSKKNWKVSINVVDFSYIVRCIACNKRIVIRNLFSERQKNALSF